LRKCQTHKHSQETCQHKLSNSISLSSVLTRSSWISVSTISTKQPWECRSRQLVNKLNMWIPTPSEIMHLSSFSCETCSTPTLKLIRMLSKLNNVQVNITRDTKSRRWKLRLYCELQVFARFKFKISQLKLKER
jgi:hypothetical protein